MRRIILWLFVLSLLSVVQSRAQEVKPEVLEYWFDGFFDARKSLNANNSATQNIDVGSLGTGIHSIEMRVRDTKGRWGTPILRYFLKPEKAYSGDSRLTYSYWIDGDMEHFISGTTNGTLSTDIDVSKLSVGLHSLNLNFADSRGRLSQTLHRYFLKPNVIDSKLAVCRYWIDDPEQTKTSTLTDGSLMLDIDVSRLNTGLHSLCYQIVDQNGQSGAPSLHYFIKPEAFKSQLATHRYWIDDAAQARTGTLADENVMQEIDVSELRAGLHTFGYQVADQNGRLSAPSLRYFIIPEPADMNLLTSYVYWFNDGSRCMIEAEPSSAFNFQNLSIEIADIEPSAIGEYTFDVESEKVSTTEKISFGLQVQNGGGIKSVPIITENVHIILPIDPQFLSLSDGESQTFAKLESGQIQGLKLLAESGDSLALTLSSHVNADFYADNGTKLDIKEQDISSPSTYRWKPASATTYMLITKTSGSANEISATLQVVKKEVSAITQISANAPERYTFDILGRTATPSAKGLLVRDNKVMLVR